MTGRAFVDTNVLVYAVDPADPRKRQIASKELLTRANDIVLSAQVLSEFYSAVTGRLAAPMCTADARVAVEQLRRHPVVPIDDLLVLEGIEVSIEARISYWDGLIIAAARAGGCQTVLTEDLSHGSTIGGLRIVNPFTPER